MTQHRRFRTLHGAGPLHLLALLASFAIAAAAVIGWFQRTNEVVDVLEWFAAAIVVHDLVLLPLYSLLDWIAFGRRRERRDRAAQTTGRGLVNPTPYLRVPAILSGLLLAVFFPGILGLGAQTELFVSGIRETGYLARWLLATGTMFALSGVTYAVAVARTKAPVKADDSDADQVPDADQRAPAAPNQAAHAAAGNAAEEAARAAAEEGVPAAADEAIQVTAEEAVPAAPDQAVQAAADQAASAAADEAAPDPDRTEPSDIAIPPPPRASE